MGWLASELPWQVQVQVVWFGLRIACTCVSPGEMVRWNNQCVRDEWRPRLSMTLGWSDVYNSLLDRRR